MTKKIKEQVIVMQELTEQLLHHLQNIYGLDTDYWQDDLKGMLDDAFDY